jgi:diaminopimelate epimerase
MMSPIEETRMPSAKRATRRLGEREFAKYHALGNDYIVVDGERFGVRLTRRRVRELCDRNRGIGSDGILSVARSRRADFRLRILNPDGSEAEKSGNGLRICARFLRDCGYTRKSDFSIETLGGVVRARLTPARGTVRAIRVDMGRARFGRARFGSGDVGARGPAREMVGERLRAGDRVFRVTCVSVGNPHCVLFARRLDAGVLQRYGPLIENHRSFPRRVNVQLARVRSRRSIDALIWERGAGVTLASGSSAAAVAAAGYRNGLVDRRVSVHMPGGDLRIEIGQEFELAMTGPATPIFHGRLW